MIDGLLAERSRVALAAARISPPAYIKAELGERPTDPAKRAEWDRGVRTIEGYRQRHGIGDRDTALGPEPKDRTAQRQRDAARRSIEQTQRRLHKDQARRIERTRTMGIER